MAIEKKFLDLEGLKQLVTKIKEFVGDIGHFEFKSSVANVASLPALDTVQNGWVYEVIARGKTTANFVEGAGKEVAATSEVICVTVDVNSTPTKKWALLGPIFDVEDRLQFGTDFPASDLVDGRVFLYMGDNVYYYTAFTPTYEEVTPEGSENPSELHWYTESSGVYSLTSDTSVQAGTTYYTCADDPAELGLYEDNSGTTLSIDTYVDPSKTYYVQHDRYIKGTIYEYSESESDWVAQTDNVKMVAITSSEIDALFD